LSVKIRLKRLGREHIHSFRICVADTRTARDGRVIEEIGSYLPQFPDAAKQVQVKADRAAYWLGVGAQPSHTVAILLKKAGVPVPVKQRKSKKAKKTGETT
jgi:small subunit ribosomal protein S16